MSGNETIHIWGGLDTSMMATSNVLYQLNIVIQKTGTAYQVTVTDTENTPLSRTGHSMDLVAPDKVLMFGGVSVSLQLSLKYDCADCGFYVLNLKPHYLTGRVS